MMDLTKGILNGDSRSIARAITLVENNLPESAEVIKKIHAYTGRTHVVGVTGVMGSGKSTLVCELADSYRKHGKNVGVVAIDPTSPFSGGALLGDRVRMMRLSNDDGIFIRSMGTRGTLGGLTSAVYDAVEILDASGKDVVLVETVGVGQAEVDVVKIADTTLVVLVPGLGDSIQTIKAGIMEIADIFVVNKADRPGVDQIVTELESLINISSRGMERKTPIVKTIANQKEGVDDLFEMIQNHRKYLDDKKLLDIKRKKRYEAELIEIIRKKLMNFIFDESKFKDKVEKLIDQISKKQTDPYSAANQILGKILK